MPEVNPLAEEIEKQEAITIDVAVNVIERLRFFLGRGMAFITDAPDCEIASWQFSFAIGSDNCIGHTMSSKAQDLGCSTACLSKGATKVTRMLNIPPSPYMLDAKTRGSYRDLRRRQEAVRNTK